MQPVPSDLIGLAARSPLEGSTLLELGAGALDAPPHDWGVTLLVDRAGALPDIDPARCDVMVTTRADAPAPWVSVPPQRLDAQLAAMHETATRAPLATAMLARLLRLGEGLAFDAALELESLAYSALLGGAEFGAWLDARSDDDGAEGEQGLPPVRYDREGDRVTLTLASPGNHNAMTAAMRDGLWEALVNVLEDPSVPQLVLRGQGRCFSTGGHLPEFGTARDPARAHAIRTARSCAAVLHRLGTRGEVFLHGACIGSGIEVPAAASRRVGASDLMVQLPELRMGLIPGAGGTVTLARAIGRHRLLWLALGAFRLGAAQARDWGLIHGIEP